VISRVAAYLVCLLALAIAVVPSAAGEPDGQATGCVPRQAHIIAADGQAAVYVTTGGDLPYTEVYGCAFGHLRNYALGERRNECDYPVCAGISRLTLAGRFVGYAQIINDVPLLHGGNGWAVDVRNLVTGALHRVLSTTPSLEGTGSGMQQLVVKSDGAVAWIVSVYLRGSNGFTYEVRAFDKAGGRLLASATDIDPHSLALAGSTLYWTQGGRPMSAPLN